MAGRARHSEAAVKFHAFVLGDARQSRPSWSITVDADPIASTWQAQEIADVVHQPAYEYRSARRHNGRPMLPPSALEYQARWESAHGDNAPILTEQEIARLRKVR